MCVVSESETCHIYEVVLHTLKVVACNLSEHKIHWLIPQHNTSRLDVRLLLNEMARTSINSSCPCLEIDLAPSHFLNP
jgi:hypothetical protein